MKFLKNILNGFAFGVANIIPGVSGGTLALILGFYERLLTLLHNIKPKSLSNIWVAYKKEGKAGLKKEWLALDLNFAVQLGIGAVLAIGLLSPLMTYLLRDQFSPTYSFFLGLILISTWVPFKLVKKWNLTALFSLSIGLVATVAVAAAVNPADKLISKSLLLQAQLNSETLSLMSSYSGAELLSIAFAGFVGISAMLLPGISGSLMLILMGKYEQILAAIIGARKFLIADLIFLGVFVVGMIIGMMIMSRLISFAMKYYSNTTHAFLTGLVLGSLYSLWPFKKNITVDLYKKENGSIELFKGLEIPTNLNIAPSIDMTFWLSLAFFITGVLLMLFFLKRETAEN